MILSVLVELYQKMSDYFDVEASSKTFWLIIP